MPEIFWHLQEMGSFGVGLASWLLGLRTAEQVARDPLWGSLFENFIILEALKDRLNAGESTEMYF